MKGKLCYDLDGVLRDLWAWFRVEEGMPSPREWDFTWKGLGAYEIIRTRGCRPLFEAPPTMWYPYLKSIQPSPVILTSQPPFWRKRTKVWIDKWLPDAKVIYATPSQKIYMLRAFAWYLIEDSPRLSSYERVILIDKPYNREVKAQWRVRTPLELKSVIEGLVMEGKLEERLEVRCGQV